MIHYFQPEGGLSPDAVQKRKPYQQPLLERLGDLRTKTLGNSIEGISDSGGAMWQPRTGTPLIPGFPILPDGSQDDPIVPPLPPLP